MSLIFVDGFDHYLAPLQKWDAFFISGANAQQPPPVNPTFGRNSGGCLEFIGALSGPNAGNSVAKNFPNLATVFCGFALWADLGSSLQDTIICRFMDGGTLQVDLRLTPAGHFYFTRNGTVLGSQSTNAISSRAWHYIEILVTINPSTGVATLNVDGSNTGWLNLTGQNTRNSANSQTGQIQIGSVAVANAGCHCFFDDFYLANTSGSFNTSFLGDVKVQAFMPTGNGTSSQYTQNEASWVATTVAYLGHVIVDSNANLQLATAVTGDAKTSGSAPTWATGVGVTTSDNHVTWTCLGATSQYLDVNQNPPEGSSKRRNNTAYTVGTAIWDDNGSLQLCTAAGTTSGTVTPTWNGTIGGTTTDGTVTWTNLGLGEDTYLSDATVGHISRFTFASIVASSIQAVSVTMRARKDDASVRSIRGCALSGGTAGDNGSDLVMSTSYQMVEGILESDPNTGSAWTISAVNAAEFGIKTTA